MDDSLETLGGIAFGVLLVLAYFSFLYVAGVI